MKRFYLLAFIFGVILTMLTLNAKQNQQSNFPVIIDCTGASAKEKVLKKLKERVAEFDSRGEYEFSYRLIDSSLKKNYSLTIFEYAISHIEAHFSQLKTKNSFDSVSKFVDPTSIFDKVAIANYVFVLSEGMARLIIGETARQIANSKKKKAAEAYDFRIADIKDVKHTLEQYEISKRSLAFYLKLAEDQYLHENDGEESKNQELWKKCKSLKEQMIKSRCDFISYTVLSPYLAETSRKLYIATLGIDDKKKIKEAVKFLAHHCHSSWRDSSHQDVRVQYFNVLKEIKNNVGQTEWDELKVLTTLLDSYDDSKKMGAELWWTSR